MKAKILLLTVGYNDSDANSICARNVAEELYSRGNVVDMCCIKKSINDVDGQTSFGKLFYVLNEYTKILCRLEQKGVSFSKLPKLIQYAIKIKQKIKSIGYTRTGNQYGDTIIRKDFYAAVQRNQMSGNYDAIVAIAQPFGWAVLANELKERYPGAKIYLYMLDPYIYNYTLPQNKIEYRKKQFKRFTNNLDGIIFTRGIKEEAEKHNCTIRKRSITVDLPNMIPHKTMQTKNYLDKIELMFAGRFYPDIRNPQKMFNVLLQILDERTIFSMFSRGCDAMANSFTQSCPHVKQMDFLPHEKYVKYFEGVDILVNLENTIPNQLPSKVFEYIASGKPIINFYEDENSMGLHYFCRYPLAFNFNLNHYKTSDIIRLRGFIAESVGKRLTYDEATALMQEARAENVLKVIADFIMADLGYDN